MEEKKFVTFKKEELGVREYIKGELGKGRISDVSIEYTPVGEKIIVGTSRPGLVIGRKGEKIEHLTRVLKKRFKLDNPHIEIKEITEPTLDSQLVADEIAILLERRGPLKFKMIAYRLLQQIMNSGALGAEIVLSGKLPSERARTWRFAQGYLKKTGEPSKAVHRSQSQAKTLPGIVGVKVSILPPDAHLHDRISVNEELRAKIREIANSLAVEEVSSPKRGASQPSEKSRSKSESDTKKTTKKKAASKKAESKSEAKEEKE